MESRAGFFSWLSSQKGPMTPFTGVIISPQLFIYKFIFGHL